LLSISPSTVGYAAVKDRIRDPGYPQLYFPDWMDEGPSDVLSILVDCALKPDAGLLQTLRLAIHEVEPWVGVRLPVVLEEMAAQELARERFTLRILQLISALALALSVLGIFSVRAYSVGLRSREFGVRLALGAQPRLVFGSVLKRGLVLGGFGVALGLGGAWGLTRFLRSLLYEANPLDAGVYVGVPTVVLAATALACLLPASRAARTDPATLLKTE
jgi:predicted lysophospholipase L1 biosynthesis ABC-type transport system permease subunit